MNELTPLDFKIQIEKTKQIWEEHWLTIADFLFTWEEHAQEQCDKFNMSMYQRMEIIAKVFNSYL